MYMGKDGVKTMRGKKKTEKERNLRRKKKKGRPLTLEGKACVWYTVEELANVDAYQSGKTDRIEEALGDPRKNDDKEEENQKKEVERDSSLKNFMHIVAQTQINTSSSREGHGSASGALIFTGKSKQKTRRSPEKKMRVNPDSQLRAQ